MWADARSDSQSSATRAQLQSPAALGPYSQAISGMLGLVPETMKFAGDSVEEQTEQAMKNIGEVLKAGGCTYADVVKTTILLAEMDDFGKINPIYGAVFPEDAPPARSCFTVKDLPLGAKIEIEVIGERAHALALAPARPKSRPREDPAKQCAMGVPLTTRPPCPAARPPAACAKPPCPSEERASFARALSTRQRANGVGNDAWYTCSSARGSRRVHAPRAARPAG